jgi:hypothetical protein
MTHLTPDELIDAMEGLLAADRQAHLATCDECQGQLAGLSMTLSAAKQTSVPEPSPLFWRHFSERVGTAIDQGASAGTSWPSWMRWQILVPLGAVALIILGLVVAVPKPESRDSSQALQALQAPQASQAPDTWVMVTELVGEIDLDVASAAGVIEPGVAEEAVLHLTAEEQLELTRLLKAELQRAKS